MRLALRKNVLIEGLGDRADFEDLQERYSCSEAIEKENNLQVTHGKDFVFSDLVVTSGFYPYNRTRVELEEDRYINANWVKGLHSGKWWISARMPQELLRYNFFSMFFSKMAFPCEGNNSKKLSKTRDEFMLRTIVQLNDADSKGSYLPLHEKKIIIEDKISKKEPITITVEKQITKKSNTDYVTRAVELTRGKEKVHIFHISYCNWKDNGTPTDQDDDGYRKFLQFIEHVRAINKNPNRNKKDPPIVVHCHAGIGRTGTFIGADSLFSDPEKSGKEYKSSFEPLEFISSETDRVAREIDYLRDQRPALVQGFPQVNYLVRLDLFIRKNPKATRRKTLSLCPTRISTKIAGIPKAPRLIVSPFHRRASSSQDVAKRPPQRSATSPLRKTHSTSPTSRHEQISGAPKVKRRST